MTVAFFILSLLLVFSALGVVALKNPMHCALSLLINVLGVAAVYANLHAHFLMVAQIIVYAGAVIVLILFVIMLLNIRGKEGRQFNVLHILGGLSLVLLFVGVCAPILNDAFRAFEPSTISVEGGVKDMGLLLFSKYYFLFELSGMLLFAATVGAVMLGRRDRVTKKEASNASS